MKYLAGGLAAAAFLLCAVPTGAAPIPQPPAAQSDEAQARALQNWLAETAAWTQGYDALTSQQVDTLSWLLDGAETLMEKLQTGGPAAAQTWAAVWGPQARARLEADEATYTSLSTQAPPFPRTLPTTPALRARIEVVGRTSDQVGGLMVAARQASEDYIQVVEAAASGRDEDLARIDPARLGLLATQLQAEITMMQSGSAGLTGPSVHLSRSAIAGNRALIVWLNHNKRVFSGQTYDAAAAARAIREQSAEMRREAEGMRHTIENSRAELASQPGFGETSLADVLEQLLVSFVTSAEIEARMADALDQLAEAVLSEDEGADDLVAPKIETLSIQRMDLDAARRALMARSGG